MSHMSAAAAAGVGGAPLAVAHRPCKSQADVCEGAGEPTHLEDCAFKTVFLNDELLVVDKPHYVRLQGDFAVTVLKLLHHHHPTVPRFWFIHQLDYATSGLLCIGLTKRCTAAASDLFSQRTTRKQYLAIVHGHVQERELHVRDLEGEVGAASTPGHALAGADPGPTSSTLPVGEGGGSAGAGEAAPTAGAGGCAALLAQDPFFQGISKPLSRAALYRRRVADARRRAQRPGLAPGAMDASGGNIGGSGDCGDSGDSGPESGDTLLLRYPHWPEFAGLVPVEAAAVTPTPPQAAVSEGVVAWATRVMGEVVAEEAAVADLLRGRKRAAAGATAAALRAGGSDTSGVSGTTSGSDSGIRGMTDTPCGPTISFTEVDASEDGAVAACTEVTINLPVASMGADEFRMCVGGRDNPGDPATTALRVLRRGVLAKGGQPASLLLLRPLTGRRHQLRVHCCAIGHPIVGDATYCPGMDDEPRMYLHAWKLELPFSLASKCSIKAPLAFETEEPFGAHVLLDGPLSSTTVGETLV